MNASEAATVLAVVAVLDGRHKPTGTEEAAQKAKAWALVLDPDLPVESARNLVAQHYSESNSAIMPADLNRSWRALRRQQAESERQRRIIDEIRRAELSAVPMPPEVRERIQKMIGTNVTGE